MHSLCLFLILLAIAVKVDKKYYLQILLKECKYAVQKIKMKNTINEELNLNDVSDGKIISIIHSLLDL